MDTTIEKFIQKYNIRTENINNKCWFVVTDICKALNLCNTSEVIKRLYDYEKNKIGIKTIGGIQTLCVVNLSGLKKIILASRKPGSIDMCKQLDIDYNYKIIPKETEFMYNIKLSFSNEIMVDQFSIGNEKIFYRIDLYFPRHKLAIEFDENDQHNSTNKQKDDLKRQTEIEHILDCKFIRVKENENIFNIINLIHKHIVDKQYPISQN